MANFDEVYDRYHQASQQFEYYITGLATAVLAYSIQSFDAGKYENYVWLAPFGWVFLLVAVGTGLVRLEWIVTLLGSETRRVEIQNMYDSLHKNIGKILEDALILEKICNGLPQELTIKGTEKRIQKNLDDCSKSIEYLNKQQNKAAAIAERAYRIREWSLIIGLFFLGLLKALNL